MVFKSSGIQKLYVKGIFFSIVYLGIILALTFGSFSRKEKTEENIEYIDAPVDTYSWILKKQLTDEDLEGKDKKELRLMRNYYFARHGLIFRDEGLTNYFSQFDWYEPVSKNVDSRITKQELENIKLIMSYEKKVNER